MDELLRMIRSMGLPFAYDHFAEGESPSPPFLVYLLPESRHFPADGKVYHRITAVQLELYTDRKDPELECAVETVLDFNGVFYRRSETWIDSEKLYEVLYSFEWEE